MMSMAVRWFLTGLLATLTMDIGSALSRATGLTAGVPPSLLGRWFAALARGELAQGSVLSAPRFPAEVPVALVGHYLIGIGLTALFLTVARAARLESRPATQFGWALAFGVLTNILPWLVMFPSMGFGPFGQRAPAALLLLRTSFVNHLFFGAGLGLASLGLRSLAR